MNDITSATVVCPLGHGLFIIPIQSHYSSCPSCGMPLIEVDDDTMNRCRPDGRSVSVVLMGRSTMLYDEHTSLHLATVAVRDATNG